MKRIDVMKQMDVETMTMTFKALNMTKSCQTCRDDSCHNDAEDTKQCLAGINKWLNEDSSNHTCLDCNGYRVFTRKCGTFNKPTTPSHAPCKYMSLSLVAKIISDYDDKLNTTK